jgi:hypothetical protein
LHEASAEHLDRLAGRAGRDVVRLVPESDERADTPASTPPIPPEIGMRLPS